MLAWQILTMMLYTYFGRSKVKYMPVHRETRDEAILEALIFTGYGYGLNWIAPSDFNTVFETKSSF